ncbi:DUF4214 domain-containing protein [Methylobacterium sp. J-078]|uniref:DUF4214 domain-containing protein n=1 Tax=Methylobacterium sp. J-078 TaxID=2836657 RepID=UPI001FBB2AC6|nr:DUF4214 domain-containing protein [Methylobacterium sp. J-078]MCJ2045944.1 DUF4214 domain-containing protein [Methylobacterium sp. J-078]
MAYQSDITLTTLGLPTNKPAPAPLAANFVSATALSPETGNDFIDAFINNGRHYVNADGGSQPVVIPYYFGSLTQTAAQAARGVNTPYTWRPFETAAYEKAVLGWEAVANVDFVRTNTQESALFVERLEDQATAGGTVSASHSLPSTSTTAKSQGTYNFEAVNTRQWTPDNLEPGGNFYRTFIHETGHGLGLKHPHDPGSGAFNPDFFPGITADDTSAVRQRSLGTLELNHMFGSVMSYLHGYSFDEQGHIDVVATRQRPVADDYFLDHGFAATPMAYDIAAIQDMYGANTNYANGDNVYVLPDSNDPHPFVRGEPNEVGVPESIIYQPDTAFWACLWDTGGTDEMRYEGARDAILDLTAATLDYSVTGYGVLSYAAFIGGGYTIANGVVIENATGGSGNDSITGNAAANVLVGNAGNDTLTGHGGNDTIDGGAGFDTAVFTTRFADTLLLQGGTTTIFSGAEGVDTLTGIEQFRFTDVNIGFQPDLYGSVQTGIDSNGVKVAALFDGLLGRSVDSTGLIDFTEGLKNGGTVAQVADVILHSAEYTARFGDVNAESNTSFVTEIYQTALGRAPDQGGLDAHVAALNAGYSRAEIAANIALSPENFAGLSVDEDGIFVPDAEAFAAGRMYFGLLDRPGDAAGVLNFKSFLEGGATTTQAAQAFIDSTEYQSKFIGLSNADFIDQLYENTLGRDPDSIGFDGFMTALSNGTSRAEVAVAITQSFEAQDHFASVLQQGWVAV